MKTPDKKIGHRGGGIQCDCCRKGYSKKGARVAINRRARRTFKIEIE